MVRSMETLPRFLPDRDTRRESSAEKCRQEWLALTLEYRLPWRSFPSPDERLILWRPACVGERWCEVLYRDSGCHLSMVASNDARDSVEEHGLKQVRLEAMASSPP